MLLVLLWPMRLATLVRHEDVAPFPVPGEESFSFVLSAGSAILGIVCRGLAVLAVLLLRRVMVGAVASFTFALALSAAFVATFEGTSSFLSALGFDMPLLLAVSAFDVWVPIAPSSSSLSARWGSSSDGGESAAGSVPLVSRPPAGDRQIEGHEEVI